MYVRNIISFQRQSIEWYSLAIHAIGSVWMIYGFLHMMVELSDPKYLIPMFTNCMLIYTEGVIFALAFLCYCHKVIKREELRWMHS
jgi:hypothetical protein